MKNTLKVRLVKSPIGKKKDHIATIKGLGLRKINSIRDLEDTPAIRGMISKVSYMVEVIET